jgi:hypothetical protein
MLPWSDVENDVNVNTIWATARRRSGSDIRSSTIGSSTIVATPRTVMTSSISPMRTELRRLSGVSPAGDSSRRTIARGPTSVACWITSGCISSVEPRV